MQILPAIMRLLVILSASLLTVVVRAGTLVSRSDVVTSSVVATGSVGGSSGGAVLFLRRPPGMAVPTSVALPRPRSIQDASSVGAQSTGSGQPVSEKNVYRTKLSKLKLILLADMLNDIPPQLELITCLANSSTLNVTTKHCACETYSCKDLLTSSPGSSPFNLVNQRKIHNSCRDYCCRKKKFNRSIDPTIQNAVAAVFRHNSFAPSRTQSSSADNAAGVLVTSSTLSSSSSLSSSLSHAQPARQSPRRHCGGSTVNQIAISSDEGYSRDPTRTNQPHSVRQHQQQQLQQNLPWLYRVILIEKGLTICAGTLIHPSVLLTTAVCVINKNPDQLIVRRQSSETGRIAVDEEQSRAIRRIVIPDQFATTFERLENNVALLVLEQDKGKHQPSDEEDNTVFKQALFRNISRTAAASTTTTATIWLQQHAEVSPNSRRNNSSSLAQDPSVGFPPSLVIAGNKPNHQPESSAYICLSSIINHPSPAMSNICQTYSWRKLRKSASAGRSSTGGAGGAGSRRQRLNQRVRQRSRTVRLNRTGSGDDGTNYITANISIFPANSSECRREHRDYLQHQGNLCAGPVDKSRSLHVDLSGSPLICTERSEDGATARVELRGILTWSTDINRAPHLFTNLTTYRSWIEDELDKLDQLELLQQSS
ncbi:uncharacterized protein LOC135713688 [Ochlerotatus camptorhynchus]|uniref:uncharacterized protein LOC135713688 n=1 Tax=Ochlerotatus camptorhynchus TaxID=644619 RepID=UPI0031E33CCE